MGIGFEPGTGPQAMGPIARGYRVITDVTRSCDKVDSSSVGHPQVRDSTQRSPTPYPVAT